MIERLKFRGKATIAVPGQWIKCPEDVSVAKFFEMVELSAIDPSTVGQWTGLKDSKGVEIWEGDRICWKNLTNNTVWNETVVFSEGCFVGDETDETISPGQTRVIGNVHDKEQA